MEGCISPFFCYCNKISESWVVIKKSDLFSFGGSKSKSRWALFIQPLLRTYWLHHNKKKKQEGKQPHAKKVQQMEWYYFVTTHSCKKLSRIP
jgi:hypothetical protein